MAEKKIKTREVIEKVKEVATQPPNTQRKKSSLTKSAISKAKIKTEEEVKRQELQSFIKGFLEVTQKASSYISWTSI